MQSEKSVFMEGVETQAQAEYMKRCGADMIQGFYYARPMPEKQLIRFFSEQNPK